MTATESWLDDHDFQVVLVAGCWQGVEVIGSKIVDRLTGRYPNTKAGKKRAERALARALREVAP